MSNYDKIAHLLIEKECNDEDKHPKCTTYFDRLVIRLSTVPVILAQLEDAVMNEHDGNCVIQLAFHKLPVEVMSAVKMLIAPPAGVKLKTTKFVKDRQALIGFELTLREDDMPGDAFDMAV